MGTVSAEHRLRSEKALTVYVEETILRLPKIWINAGQRGLLVEIEPACLENLLQVTRVCVAQRRALEYLGHQAAKTPASLFEFAHIYTVQDEASTLNGRKLFRPRLSSPV